MQIRSITVKRQEIVMLYTLTSYNTTSHSAPLLLVKDNQIITSINNHDGLHRLLYNLIQHDTVMMNSARSNGTFTIVTGAYYQDGQDRDHKIEILIGIIDYINGDPDRYVTYFYLKDDGDVTLVAEQALKMTLPLLTYRQDGVKMVTEYGLPPIMEV